MEETEIFAPNVVIDVKNGASMEPNQKIQVVG